MIITTASVKPSGTSLYVDGVYSGLVSQHPDHADVMDRGKWRATIHTSDGGRWCFGPFGSEEEAVDVAKSGLEQNLTHAQWTARK